MKKVLWFDLETTGIDPERNGIIQFAGLAEIDGAVVESFEIKMQPHEGAQIDDEALEVTGFTREAIRTFTPHAEAYRQIDDFLARHVSRFDRNDKFYPAGYNVRFDLEFLSRMFKRFDQYGLGSFTNWRMLDPQPILNLMDYMGRISLPNHRLQTACDHFGVKLENAHDALADITATRALMQRLLEHVSIDSMHH
ncbi:3'-5' exonuclease [Chlorobium phaeovibrioides]|uniref:3'-5' exonuclease n=1 Tax=Chlorobium phaeovibrioides TaxID=1094 RepID=A0A432ATZ4_CHLPH|nr:3'-5' exonuclease [Chlorobium phaeovibrioides]KAA6231795.1 3'-5' exonuclease [Chlorobium phaeovibrioides]MDT9547596.1 3'-5' exonuclease [Chlorobium phaeovibrioides]MWV54149.1 3'-5' exonuclease [Chlorobium phaeovibrioides]QEQ57646.1 3'-5' exonuclease [Chlorobium phaeovibrioides]RTY34646.1 3'-5' exonuclease [Chlorobium phaeovibrioides]